MKKKVINYIFNLLESNLYATNLEIYNKAFRNRIIGYRSEIEFKNKFNKTTKLLDGGYILPREDKAKTLENPVYFTISSNKIDEYLDLYKLLSKNIFSYLFFIQFENYEISKWSHIINNNNKFPIPPLKLYQQIDGELRIVSNNINSFISLYKEKNPVKVDFKISPTMLNECFNMLNSFDEKNLIDLYVDRLIFDGLLGFKKKRGIASDIDFVSRKNEEFNFLEIKEKDLSKKTPGFGIDTRRIKSIKKLKDTYSTNYYYIVKQVNNQKERKFISWHYIEIDKFINKTINNKIIDGGLGMSNLSNNPTLVCELKFFNKI